MDVSSESRLGGATRRRPRAATSAAMAAMRDRNDLATAGLAGIVNDELDGDSDDEFFHAAIRAHQPQPQPHPRRAVQPKGADGLPVIETDEMELAVRALVKEKKRSGEL